jgi:hypothetical protein
MADKCITTQELATAVNTNFELTFSNAVSKRLVTGNNIRKLTKMECQGYDGHGDYLTERLTTTYNYLTNTFERPCFYRILPSANVSWFYEQSTVEPYPNNASLLAPNRVWAHLYNDDYSYRVGVVAIKCENPGNAYLQLETYGKSSATTPATSWNFMINGTSEADVTITQAASTTLGRMSIIMPRLQYSKNGITWENCAQVESVAEIFSEIADSSNKIRCERRTKIYFKDCIDNTIYLSNFIYNTSYRLTFSADSSTGFTGARCSILALKDMDDGGDTMKHVTVAGNLMALVGNSFYDVGSIIPSDVNNYTYTASLFAHVFQEINHEYTGGTVYDLEYKDGLAMPLSNSRGCYKMFQRSPIKQPVQFYRSEHTTMGANFCVNMYAYCNNLDRHIRSPFPKDPRFQGETPSPFMLGAGTCNSMFIYSNIVESDYWYVDIDLSVSTITYPFRWCFSNCTSLAKVPRMYVLEKDSAFPASLAVNNTFSGMLFYCHNVKEIWLLRDPPVLSNTAWTSTYFDVWRDDDQPTSCTLDDADFANKNFRFFTRGLFNDNSGKHVTLTNIWTRYASNNPNNFGPGKACTYPANTYFFHTAWGYTVKKVEVNFDPQGRVGIFPNHALFCWTIYNGVPTRKFIIYGATTAINSYTMEIAVTLGRENIAPYVFDSVYLNPYQNYWPGTMWAVRFHNEPAYRPNDNGHLLNSALPDGTRLHDHVTYENSQLYLSSDVNKASSSLTMDYSIQALEANSPYNNIYLEARRITTDTNKVVPFRIGWGCQFIYQDYFQLQQTAFLNNKNDVILFERRVISNAITGYTLIDGVKISPQTLNGVLVNPAFILPYKPNTTTKHGFEITFKYFLQDEAVDSNSLNLGFNLFGVYNGTGYTNWRFFRSPDNARDGLVYFNYASSSKTYYLDAGYYDGSLGVQTVRFVNGTFYPANGGEPITDLPQMRSGTYYSRGIGIGQLLSGQTGAFYSTTWSAYNSFDIYHLAFYDAETRLYDLYPVKRNSDSVVGFYDIINNQFYSSTTGVPFEESNVSGNDGVNMGI